MRRHGYIILIAFTLIGIFLPLSSVTAGDDLSGILGAIMNKYNPMASFSVHYKRDISTKSMTLLGDGMRTDTANGMIHFKPPHFLRLQQFCPLRMHIFYLCLPERGYTTLL